MNEKKDVVVVAVSLYELVAELVSTNETRRDISPRRYPAYVNT